MIYAGTGHRLNVLGPEGQEEATHEKVTRFAISILPGYTPTKVISGMAVGWDTAFALAALEHNIPLIAAVPFVGQESIWPQKAKDRYFDILKHAEVHIICEGGFAGWKYHERDKWMVANSDAMIALWNGHPKGGTAATVRYAKKAERTLFNVWPGWENFEPAGFWSISDPGIPPGRLSCIKCDGEVVEDTQENVAEQCNELGYYCFGCGLFTWKAKLAKLK